MMKKLFSELVKPSLEYAQLHPRQETPEAIAAAKTVTLLYKKVYSDPETDGSPLLRIGSRVKTDQKLVLSEGDDTYLISPVTGTITALEPFAGNFGVTCTAIRIEAEANEVIDDEFKRLAENPTLETAVNYLSHVPGNPPLALLTDTGKPINTLVVNGLDNALLTTTNQYVLVENHGEVTFGIEVLKKITGIDHVVVLVPQQFAHGFGHIGGELKAVSTSYPSAHPYMVAKDVLGKTIAQGSTFEDMGIAFFSAEAVASIGRAFETGRIPSTKIVTIIEKDGSCCLASVGVGTPVSHILDKLSIAVNDQDRVVFGGPMTGSPVLEMDQPVLPDTDVIFLQDKKDMPEMTDISCINCGDCVRVCPVKIPVNMLIRFLSAGQYEEAEDAYDLQCCIECGFCSYVCVSRIPITQYVRLAKYELTRTRLAEETDVE